ncbi:RNA-directed DNA polymerase, eukaryota, reverse transcriptase zinc-binding domain protein [Tanacetum coccineum]|uniref:RNA-directed DNA polymerase, eukaryota, reverse transcriptase zinc-binding domain protein n=1 Tax=Tanacetum coccineum TaxID=301880 RepID=A0ABQ5HYG5_9ASTR
MSLSMTQILILIMILPTSSTNLYNTNTRHTRVNFVEGTLTRVLIVKQGTHPSLIKVPVTIKSLVLTNLHSILRVSHNSLTVVSSVEVHIIVMIAKQGTCPSMIRVLVTIRTLVMTNLHSILRISNNSSIVVRSVEVLIIALNCQTRNQLVYEPNPGNNYDFSCVDQPPQYHIDQSPPQDLIFDSLMHTCRENNRILEEMLRTQMPNSFVVLNEPEGSDDYTEATYDKKQFLSDYYTAPVTPPAYTPSIPFLATTEPTDTLLMGDEVISTIPARETDEFIKSSVDDFVPISRESEVTSDSVLECAMPATTPLPHTDNGETISTKYLNITKEEDLEQDITKEEVKRAVWDCGVDKSPGPDGFSFYFYRHFWSMIEDDVFGAVEYFFINGDIPNGCNSNFIALIPKIIDANMVKDFRPISLIGSLYKIIAKLLANRLVGVLSNLINEVQSAFVADRQILDGPFILNEVLQWCRKKRKHALIFKVDFEKAYDSVRWDFLDDVLDKFGFGVKWRNWIQSCLRSSRGSILINGSPTKEFQFFRGLKQGDPLSPFLFILVMESLHISFQRVVDAGLFNGINLSSTVNLSHLFYADDAIFIGQWNELNIDTLVRVLECFFRASGLRINMSKSKIMGVNVEDAKVKIAANKLGCLVLKTPFTYLGTKVGENMHRKHAWNEVVEKVLSRLSRWKLKTLSIGGRFTLLKSVLGSMPIFHMSIFKVPSSILNSLEVIRSRFFNGHEHKSNKATWFKWNKVLTSKEKGGLGVSSLFALNRGLLFKWLWRFYSQKDSLWTKVIKALYGEDGSLDKVGASAARTCWTTIVQEVKVIQAQGINIHDFIKLKLGNGEDSRFWLDKWYEGGVLKRLFPRVYALELDKNISVSSKLKAPSLVTTFRRNARSGIEQTQFDSMAEIMKTISLVPRVDRYIWSLENDGSFSVASIRKTLDDNRFQEESLSTRWVKSVPIKVNILAWKVKSNALPTRFNISRRGMDIDSIDCPICKMGVETTSHVFFQCNVVRQVMRKISSWWNVEYMEVNSYEEWRSWLVSTRIRSNIKVIIEGIYYGLWWVMWNFRNKILFDTKIPEKVLIFDNLVSSSFYWFKYRSEDESVYDSNPYSYNDTPNFFNKPQQITNTREPYWVNFLEGTLTRLSYNNSTVVSSVEVHIIVMIPKQGTCPSMIRVLVTIRTLVMTNLHSILRISNNSSTVVRENNRILEEMLRTQMPNSPVVLNEPKGSDDYTEATYDKEQCLSDHYTAPVTPPAYTSSILFLATMEPTDTLLMGDEVISTIPAKETDEFIKSSVDDFVPIPRESEVTSDIVLECDMPVTTPLPLLIMGK